MSNRDYLQKTSEKKQIIIVGSRKISQNGLRFRYKNKRKSENSNTIENNNVVDNNAIDNNNNTNDDTIDNKIRDKIRDVSAILSRLGNIVTKKDKKKIKKELYEIENKNNLSDDKKRDL